MRTIRLMGAVCLLGLVFSTLRLEAQATADQVKAAYLYNFGRYVRWPADAATDHDSSFAICVFGQDPLGNYLKSSVAGAKVQGRLVDVRNVGTAQEATDCRILFIDAEQSVHLHGLLAGLDRSPTLTVSDIPDFLQQGGMVQFVQQGDRVRFKVDLLNVSHARLTVSSELLKVAVAVQGNVRPGGE